MLESVNAIDLDDVIEKVLDAVEKQPRMYSSYNVPIIRVQFYCLFYQES